MNDLLNTIKENLKIGPADLRDLALSEGMRASIARILQSHSIDAPDGVIIKNATLFVLSGILPPTDVEAHLCDVTALDRALVRTIVDDLDVSIFAKVRSSLETLYAPDAEETAGQVSEKPNPPFVSNLPPPPPPPRIILPSSNASRPPAPPPTPPEAPTESFGSNPLNTLQVPRPPASRPIITPGTLGNIVTDKLETAVSAPVGEHTITPRGGIKKEYVADPYREPLA